MLQFVAPRPGRSLVLKDFGRVGCGVSFPSTIAAANIRRSCLSANSHEKKMHSAQTRSERKAQRSTRRQLDGLVVNIELTLVSIIQGVALSVLAESARAPLGDLRFDQWPYVANGLLGILLFWSRSMAHTLTLIRWPLEFGHNFLYIACTLIEAITFTNLTDPLRWYAFTGGFAVAAWLLFLTDLRLIRQRRDEAVGPAEEELYEAVLRDQHMNILWLVPGMALFNFFAVFCIYWWPDTLIRGGVHLVFALVQTVTLLGYLVYVVRFFSSIAPLVLKANQEESSD
jgi:hypothetical protein